MAYLTAAEFKAWRDISGSGDDTLIGDLITRAQQRIDNYCHRTFEGTAADRTFDAARDIEGATLWVYSAGDLASIMSVTNGDGTTVSSSDYVTEPRNAVTRGAPILGITLKAGSGESWVVSASNDTEDAITVNGVWAYSASAPDDIVQATVMLVGYWYDQRMSTNGDVAIVPGVSIRIPRGMPPPVKDILVDYVREGF